MKCYKKIILISLMPFFLYGGKKKITKKAVCVTPVVQSPIVRSALSSSSAVRSMSLSQRLGIASSQGSVASLQADVEKLKYFTQKQKAPSAAPMQAQSTSNLIQGLRHKWELPVTDATRLAAIMQKWNVCAPVAQTLLTRGYNTQELIEKYVRLPYEQVIPHPSLLLNATTAIDRIKVAINNKEQILICGDYDVDGMTSSALLVSCLKPLGAQIDWHIPHRVKDGYGLKSDTIEKAAQAGYKVVITVDNGITAFEPAKKAKELGIDLIITDHHLAHGGVPEAFTIVNPNQPGCQYPNKALAGVGVAFKLMRLLYEQIDQPLPPKAYEMMMLGTIADVVELKDENRFWVRHGLNLVSEHGPSPALAKLRANAGLEKPRLGSIDIAFNITPQLNALGRLSDANLGVNFLLDEEVGTIGVTLKQFNQNRKKIQSLMFKAIKDKVNKREISLRNDPVIVVSDPAFHPGVNGLVASKVVEKWYKPTILFQEITLPDGQVICKGSGRSINRFNMFEALNQCKDLLLGFGGHVCAAGLSLKKENLPEFKTRLAAIFERSVQKEHKISRHVVDAVATLAELNPTLIEDYRHLEPFGNHNFQPTLLFKDVTVAKKPEWLGFGGGHVKCELQADGQTRNVKFFFRPEMFYRLKELHEKKQSFKLIGYPDDNHWKGKRSIEINGVDIEKITA
ncbi:MAG: single-stranded-DNA-specific exonuclease RecJ [Candidatus Dependentiae bacterium]